MNLTALTRQLKRERDRLRSQLKQFNRALQALAGLGSNTWRRGRRRMSKAARAKIAQAQRARWARWRAKKKK